MPGIDYPFGRGTNLQIGPVSVPGVYSVQDTGGQNAPEHRVERDFDWSTRVGPEPVEATYNAWVDGSTLGELKQLREIEDPFPTAVGSSAIGECVLENLDYSEEGETAGAYDAQIEIREVQLASTGTAQLRVVSEETGTKSEAAGKEGGGPSIAQSETEQTTGGPDTQGETGTDDNPFSGIKSSVESWLGYDD